MSMPSPPQPRVQRERDRFEQLERDSREKLQFVIMPPSRGTAGAGAGAAPRQRSRSGSISSSSQSQSQSGSPNFNNLSLAIPTTAATTPGGSISLPPASAYPNYYDYSENIAPPPPLEHRNTHNKNMASMAMQVPIQPQQPPQQRLVDTKGPSGNSTSKPQSQRGPPSRDRPPSYSNPTLPSNNPNPDDIILPPNKVDLDAARYRRAQQQESRRERERDRDRDNRPTTRDRRPSNPTTNSQRPSSSGMGQQHHHTNGGGRPLSPESPLLTPTGPNIQRLPTPSIPNSVLQPLDAKVVEYGTLMAEAQGDMARLDEEMRSLQDRQREAEQRFLDAKSKHDDYRRQYSDVERALRGEFQARMNGGGHRGVQLQDDDVPPMPSMPSLQQYGTNGPNSRQGSGNLLNGHSNAGGGAGGPMPPRRTVSIQSDMVSQDSVRSHPKPRGRFSRLFGV